MPIGFIAAAASARSRMNKLLDRNIWPDGRQVSLRIQIWRRSVDGQACGPPGSGDCHYKRVLGMWNYIFIYFNLQQYEGLEHRNNIPKNGDRRRTLDAADSLRHKEILLRLYFCHLGLPLKRKRPAATLASNSDGHAAVPLPEGSPTAAAAASQRRAVAARLPGSPTAQRATARTVRGFRRSPMACCAASRCRCCRA